MCFTDKNSLLVIIFIFWYTLKKVIMEKLLSGVIIINTGGPKRSKTLLFLGISFALIIILLIILLISSKNSESPTNEIQGDDPTLQHHFDNSENSDETVQEIILQNIIIDDFDDWGMGILENNKYYQIQYGVHIKDDSVIGQKLGQTSDKNLLTNVEGNTYKYSKSASYMLDDNTSYYEFKGDEDIILADTGDVDTTINGKWVMSPDLLSKTSFWEFIEDPENLVLTYYPSIEELEYNYTVDNPQEFLTSCKRVSSPMANIVENGYLTVDDGSGLIYGALVYYDYETGESYLNPPSFPKLFFKANNQLGQYVTSYLASVKNN